MTSSVPFFTSLVEKLRSYDSYGSWKNKTDAQIVQPLIKTKEDKKQIDTNTAPDQRHLWFVRMFFEAVALAAEKRTGAMMVVALDINHEGFGRALIFHEERILLHRSLRNVQKFGFASLEELTGEGEKLVAIIGERFADSGN